MQIGVAADTRATAAPLIYPSTPPEFVALLSRWASASKNNRSNQLQWLEPWLAALLPTLKLQAQPELLDITARFTARKQQHIACKGGEQRKCPCPAELSSWTANSVYYTYIHYTLCTHMHFSPNCNPMFFISSLFLNVNFGVAKKHILRLSINF